jgi:hypothetical protein
MASARAVTGVPMATANSTALGVATSLAGVALVADAAAAGVALLLALGVFLPLVAVPGEKRDATLDSAAGVTG